jgi:hypothetical protein
VIENIILAQINLWLIKLLLKPLGISILFSVNIILKPSEVLKRLKFNKMRPSLSQTQTSRNQQQSSKED